MNRYFFQTKMSNVESTERNEYAESRHQTQYGLEWWKAMEEEQEEEQDQEE